MENLLVGLFKFKVNECEDFNDLSKFYVVKCIVDKYNWIYSVEKFIDDIEFIESEAGFGIKSIFTNKNNYHIILDLDQFIEPVLYFKKVVGEPVKYRGDLGYFYTVLNFIELNKRKIHSLVKEEVFDEKYNNFKVIASDLMDNIRFEFVEEVPVYVKIEDEEKYVELVHCTDKKKVVVEIRKIKSSLTDMIEFEDFGFSYNVVGLSQISLVKDLSWLSKKDYRIINKRNEFDELVEKLSKVNTPIAVDTETTGLNINRFSLMAKMNRAELDKYQGLADMLVGISIAYEEDKAYYIPIRHKLFENLDEDYVISKLKPILQTKHIVTHNGTFDWKVFHIYGINLNICDDTLIIQYILEPEVAKNSKDLKSMAKRYFGIDMIELTDFVPKRAGAKKQKIRFDMLPYECVAAYAPADADFTLKLYYKLRPMIEKEREFIYGVEIKLLPCVGFSEFYGVRLDLNEIEKLKENIEQELLQLEEKIYELAGERFEIGSTQQLARILYDKLGIPIIAYTSKGRPSTDKTTLKQLSNMKDDNGELKYPITKALLDYREKQKLLSAFLNKFLQENYNEFIFPKYNTAGANSGRIASSDPNLQQIDNDIKHVVIPDSDEYYIIDIDYSQIEYRVMASLAQEKELIELFKDYDADFHRIAASKLFGIPPEQITSDMRKKAKALNFGIPYGMGDYSLAIQIFGKATEETIREAHTLRMRYLDSMPNIRDMFKIVKERCELTGYVETYFKRKRPIKNINHPDKKIREEAKRKAGNTIIQGTAADILKIAYVRMATRIKKLGWDKPIDKPLVRIVGSIHDELLFVVHKSINPWLFFKHAIECLELKIKNFAPIYSGCAVGYSWGEAKKDTSEIPRELLLQKINSDAIYEDLSEDPVAAVKQSIFKYSVDRMYNYYKKFIVDNKLDLTACINDNTPLSVKQYLMKYFATDNNELQDSLKLFVNSYNKLYGANLEVFVSGEIDSKNNIINKDELFDKDDHMRDIDDDQNELVDQFIFNEKEDSDIIDSTSIRTSDRLSIFELSKLGGFDKKDNIVLLFNRRCYVILNNASNELINKTYKIIRKIAKPSGYMVSIVVDEEIRDTDICVYSDDIDIIEQSINS